MEKLFIVGAGFVGGTCYQAFAFVEGWETKVFDRNPKESYLKNKSHISNDINWANDIKDCFDADLIIVAVPTPMQESGECHTGIVENVIKSVRQYNSTSWICIKSTVPPGTTQKFNDQYGNICFNPEFLTEKNAYLDFVNLPYQIIGFPKSVSWDFSTNPILKLYVDASKQGQVKGGERLFEMTSTEAEMIKYTRNCYLATRLSFFNEIKQICDKLNLNYNSMKYFIGLDERVGNHYNRIDELEPEFSGVCLPKDLNGLIFESKKLGLNPVMLEATWKKNLEVAKKKTWEKEEGRAFMKESEL